jgi:hypothetical protein
MDIAYTQLRNTTCPIRHYFTLTKNKSAALLKPSTLGHLIHKIYAKALKIRNFNFLTEHYVNNELRAINAPLNTNMYALVKTHIHEKILKKIPKKVNIECQHTVITNKLPHIDSEVVIYIKPDIAYTQKNILTVCEIKTGKYKKYDPLQLHYYAWGLSLKDSNINHFVMKVFYTDSGVIEVVSLMDRDELQITIDRYLDSSCKAYAFLNINNIKEVASVLPTLIATDSIKLTKLFNMIHPEQCASCNSSIICPSYLQEVTRTFEDKMSNITVSDMLIQVNTI